MNKKNKVSVVISAYNEGQNIKYVIRDILAQDQKNWELLEILIYCDGCTDDTAESARSVGSKKVKVMEGRSRKSKPFRLGQAFKKFKGSIAVIFDGDVKLGSASVISEVIEPIVKNKNVVLTGGNTRPFEPTTFVERAVYSTFKVFEKSREEKNGGHNLFGCTGACMAVEQKFAKSIRFPKVINEDDYLYFSCVSRGFKFRHVRDAKVYYKLPSKLSDYMKQVFRSNPEAVLINFEKYFGPLVKKEYQRSRVFYALSVIKVFLQDPIPVLLIISANILARPFFSIVQSRYKLEWYTASSTKRLI